MDDFWRKLDKPFSVLAPMAGYTDSAFRLLCRENGVSVTMSELISADAIAYGKFSAQKREVVIGEERLWRTEVTGIKNQATAEMLGFFELERPFVVQLFGKYPEKFGKAAKWVTENLKPDGIDINMGCPARKVVGSDHGAALLKNTDLAVRIVKAVKENTNLPVSVKTRLGWASDDEILAFAPAIKDAGISAIMIHGRTYKDGFTGHARWDNIYKVKEMLGDDVVVIGNGDLSRVEEGRAMTNSKLLSEDPSASDFAKASPDKSLGMTEKKDEMTEGEAELDGFAIGRAAFGKPYIFLNKGEVYDALELKKLILRHAKMAYETKGDHGLIEFRKHLLQYIRCFPDAKKVRVEAVNILNLKDVEKIVAMIN